MTYPFSSDPSSDVWLSKSTNGGVLFGAAAQVALIVPTHSNQFSGTRVGVLRRRTVAGPAG